MSDTGKIASRSWPRGVVVGVVAFALGFGVGAGLRTLGRVRALADGSATAFAEWEAAEEAKASARASLEEVLAAPEDGVLAVAARYLRGATRDEIAALAEAWEFKAERVPAVVWTLLLTCWAEKDGPGALAAARRIDGEAPALEVFTLRIWAEVGPAAAVAEAEKEPKRLLPSIIDVVARVEMEVALGVIERFPGDERLVTTVLRILAERDPRAAMARADAVADPKLRKKALSLVAALWAKSDGAAALAWLEELDGDAREIDDLRRVVLGGLLEWNLEVAEEEVGALDVGAARYGLMLGIAEQKARADPAAALVWAKGLPEGNERRAALAVCLKAAAGGDPEKLLALLDEHGWEIAEPNAGDQWALYRGPDGSSSSDTGAGSLAKDAKAAILRLARTDPERAATYLGRLSAVTSGWDGSPRKSATTEFLKEWYGRAPEEAVAWMNRVPDDGTSREVAFSFVYGLSEAQREGLLGNAESVKSTPLMRELLLRSMQRSDPFPNGPERLIALAETMEGRAQAEVLGQIASRLVGIDEAKAFQLLDRLPPGEERARTVDSFVFSMPIERARTWFETLPPGDRSAVAHRSLAWNWMEADSEGASRWAASLPAGEARDAAAGAVADQLISSGERDYEMALQWAGTIERQANRVGRVEMIYREWLGRDRPAAVAALGASDLPEATIKKLLER